MLCLLAREDALNYGVELIVLRCTPAATISADKVLYQWQIETTDRQINTLVYELYGLTEEEIGVVEGRLNHE